MTKFRKVALVLVALLFCVCSFAFAEAMAENKPIAILYTNDVHCGYTDGIGYSGIAALKKSMEAQYGASNVLLVDNGDAIQGDVIGTVSSGSYIVDIMNEVGYDLCVFGNHEFDYGMQKLAERVDQSNAQYLSCNLLYTGTSKDTNVLEGKVKPYEIIDFGVTRVAFIGVATPESLVKSTPTYFQNESGEYIYEIPSGEALYSCVQSYVDAAKLEGAEYVIALTHLGISVEESSPNTAYDLIKNTSGIDVVLDGHSHHAVAQEYVTNKFGYPVLYSQTGTKAANVGVLMIYPGKLMMTTLEQPTERDADTDAFIAAIDAEYKAALEVVVAKSEIDLLTTDKNGVRTVRNQETIIGDLCADAYRAVSGADIAFVNGGGIRANINKGDLTTSNIISVHPFGNYMCMVEATGQEILDALELSANAVTKDHVKDGKAVGEFGGFLQVSGIKFTIDTSIPTSIVKDDKGMFVEVSGARRVKDVMVGSDETGWTEIDPNKTYTLASHNYKLKSCGDGYSMFKDNKFLIDCAMIDNQVLITYIRDFLGGTIPASQYKKVAGRITIE